MSWTNWIHDLLFALLYKTKLSQVFTSISDFKFNSALLSGHCFFTCLCFAGDKLVGEVSRLVVAEACIQAMDIDFTEGQIYEINSVLVSNLTFHIFAVFVL